MLPLTRSHKFRISNRLAIFAALLLVVTSLAGIGGSTITSDQGTALHAASPPAEMTAAGNTQVRKNKGFKMSLFLFRNR